MSDPRCPCEPSPFLVECSIAPGLTRLPRQRGRFGDFRRSLLASSRTAADGALRDWRADDPSDLGLMLIDVWAYLLDIVSFYDAEIGQESYLSTATRTPSSTRLTELIGYTPVPATASSAVVALRAVGRDPVLVPAGTALRSAGWDAEKPQVFEVSEDTWLYPALNELHLDSIRPPGGTGTLWLSPQGAAPEPGQAILLRDESQQQAARVAEVVRQRATDGKQYRRLVLQAVPGWLAAAAELAPIELFGFAQTVMPSVLGQATASGASTPASQHVILDTLYQHLRQGDSVIVETAAGVYARTLDTVKIVYMDAGTHPSGGEVRIPCTEIGFTTAIDTAVTRVHTRLYRLASLVNPAKSALDAGDLGAFAPVAEPMQPFDAEHPAPVAALFKGTRQAAYVSPVSFQIDGVTGAARIKADEPARIEAPLAAPITVLTNLVRVTRGETVLDEVLGSADGGKPFQSFTLKKKPLTFLPGDGPTAAAVPALEVRVNGISWSRVDSFVEAGPEDEVYVVRVAPDGTATIQFGDQAIPPTGKQNVTASYRYGAGAAKPPVGLINKLASPVAGVDGVAWSLAPSGGRDADQASSIRENAPASMLCFGRAVSLQDYEALAQAYPGVLRASAGWAFVARTQRAQVVVWVISDGSSVAGELGGYLAGLGDPDVPVVVQEATPLPTPISMEVTMNARERALTVQERVLDALSSPARGLLSVRRRRLREALFRSQLVRTVMDVEGVTSVRSLLVAGSTSVVGVTVPEGHYRLYDPVQVSVTA